MPYRPPHQHALTPQHQGRFRGFDVLDQAHTWDEVTSAVVLARLAPVSHLSFFTDAEEVVARALCDLLLAQDREPRIAVVALIDARLATGETDGWRYADMPADPEAWRQTLAAVDADAHDAHQAGFAALAPPQQAALIDAVFQTGQAKDTWHGWAGAHVWSLWTRYACAAFYSHPWAWNEIGFGGPAYPRGYKNIGIDARERWEAPDHTDADTDTGDPVPFADRVERARSEHCELIDAPSTRAMPNESHDRSRP